MSSVLAGPAFQAKKKVADYHKPSITLLETSKEHKLITNPFSTHVSLDTNMSVNDYCFWIGLFRNVSVLPYIGPAVGGISSFSSCGAFWTASVMVYNYTCDASNNCTTYYSSQGQMYPRVDGSEKCEADIAVGPNLQPFTQYWPSGVREVMNSSQASTTVNYWSFDDMTPEDKLFEYREWNETNYSNFTNYGLEMVVNSGCPICTKFYPGVYLQMCYFNCTEAPPHTLEQLVTYPTSLCPSLSSNSNGKPPASKFIMLFSLVICLAIFFLPIT
jgi:hypothetical protein